MTQPKAANEGERVTSLPVPVRELAPGELGDRLERVSLFARRLLRPDRIWIALLPDVLRRLPPGRPGGMDIVPAVGPAYDLMLADPGHFCRPVGDASGLGIAPAVSGGPRFVESVPLRADGRGFIGALCVAHRGARPLEADALGMLTDLAGWAEAELWLALAAADREDLVAELATARRVAAVDVLTGLWNRQAIFEVIGREVERCRRTDEPFAVAMIDADRFKRINDGYGHLVGDQVLKAIAHRILESIRSYDAVGRYGGEEFVALLVGCDAVAGAAAARKVAEAVRRTPIPTSRGPVTMTVSVGVTIFHGRRDGRDLLALLEAADDALLQSKRDGRDRVTLREPVLDGADELRWSTRRNLTADGGSRS